MPFVNYQTPSEPSGRRIVRLLAVKFSMILTLAAFSISCANSQNAEVVEAIEVDSKRKIDPPIMPQRTQLIGVTSIIGLMALGLAITYRNYRAWRRVAYQLGRRVEERTVELRRLSEQLNKTLESKDSFGEKCTREINESTQGILGLCSVARHDFKDERLNNFLQMVERNAVRVRMSVRRNRPNLLR